MLNLKCSFQKAAMQISAWNTPASKAVCINRQNLCGDCFSAPLTQLHIGHAARCNWIRAGKTKGKMIKDRICSTLLLASAELQQLLSAFYLTLTKEVNCLAKEEGSLIVSCCRWIAQARAKGQEAKGEEEVLLKVGAAVAQPSAILHLVHISACSLASQPYQPVVLGIPGNDTPVSIQAKPKTIGLKRVWWP